MPELSQRRIILICGFVLSVLFAAFFSQFKDEFCTRDFFLFWSAGHQFFKGFQPYLAEDFPLEVLKTCPVHFPYPLIHFPAGLPLLAPFLPLDLHRAVFLQLFCSLFLLFLIPFACQKFLHPDRTDSPSPTIFLLLWSYLPILLGLFLGQIMIFALSILVGFLVLFKRERYFVAGLTLSATIIKPHVLYLLYLYIALKALQTRSFRAVFSGLFVGVVILGLVAFVIRPTIYHEYIYAMFHTYRTDWVTPTLVTWLRVVSPWFRYAWIAMLIGGVLIAIRVSRSNQSRDIESILTIVAWSLATTPYIWSYDFALFFPIIYVIANSAQESGTGSRRNLLLLLICNVGLMVNHFELKYDFWYPWALLGLWFYHVKGSSRTLNRV